MSYLLQHPFASFGMSKDGTTPFDTDANPTGVHLQFGPHLHDARPHRGSAAVEEATAAFCAGVSKEF